MVKQEKVKKFGPKLKRKIQAKWKKLSDLDLDQTEKSPEALSAKIQTVYGRDKVSVDQEILEFRKSLKRKPSPSASAVRR